MVFELKSKLRAIHNIEFRLLPTKSLILFLLIFLILEMLATVNNLSPLYSFPLGVRKVVFDHELMNIFNEVFKEYWRCVSHCRIIIDTDFVLLIPDQTIAGYLLCMLRHAVD